MSVAGKGGRPPGLPKTGGRKKGTPNKATLAVAEKLDALGCDLVAILAGIAMNETEETPHRIRAASELLSYTYPKRAPVADQPQTDATLQVITNVQSANTADSSSAENGNGQN
jgi:hypothetical protein